MSKENEKRERTKESKEKENTSLAHSARTREELQQIARSIPTVERMAATGKGLIVSGEYGVGKSALAAIAVRAFGGGVFKVRLAIPDDLDRLTRPWQEYYVENPYAQNAWLDDLGAENPVSDYGIRLERAAPSSTTRPCGRSATSPTTARSTPTTGRGDMDSPEYRHCIDMERDRYREWAKTRQGAFETYQVLHFDAEAEEAREREHSTSWLSDRGKGASVY